MKQKLSSALLGLLLGTAPFAQAQTAFTYQGKLVDDCCPATGLYDLTFKVFDTAGPGTAGQQGTTFSMNGVPVTNGLFTVSLDFGSAPFTGAPRWLQIDARTNNAALTPVTLLPRTELTPTPYTMYAHTAGTVTNGAIQAGQLRTVGVPSDGQVLGYNGSSLVWQAPGGGSSPWMPNGSSIHYDGGNVGIGTSNPYETLDVRGRFTVFDGALDGSALQRFTLIADTDFGLTFQAPKDSAANKLAYHFNWRGGGPDAVTILGNGNVGIGTAFPIAPLDILVPSGPNGLHLSAAGRTSEIYLGIANADYGALELGGGTTIRGGGVGSSFGGNVSIGGNLRAEPNDQGNPGNVVLTAGSVDGTALYCHSYGLPFHAHNDFTGTDVVLAGGQAAGFTGDVSVTGNINVSGSASVCSLTIRGGCDLAEPFQMSAENIPAGAVVVIDEDKPGRLKMSDRAYDNRVAGIISGANGVNPGIMLKQEGTLEGTQNVALTGRVYALADASESPIRPGDLLTTSGTPGHAMKATDRELRDGAILGKAMTGLKDGKGHVLVLVNLQ